MIYVRTCAYNAEKTLKRAIESILNQTYGDFRFYILDNGSTDGTREIIRYYAEKDERIVPFYNERNFDRSENFDFWNLIDSLVEGDYICFLDADDAYDTRFLEESFRFLTENQLDMVMCGSVFMDEETWTSYGARVLPEDIVISDKESFESNFASIYWNLRAMWGKLCSAKARFPYTGAGKQPEWYPAYGGDTVNVFAGVAKSDRIGIMAKPLHYYSVSAKSTSYRWHENREKSDALLFEKGEELLVKKSGRVSDENYRMLYAVYFNAVSDTFRVLFGSDLSAEKKVEIMRDVFFHPITQKMFQTRFDVPNERRVEFFVATVIWLLELWPKVSLDSYVVYEQIFSNINPDFTGMISKEKFVWYMENFPVFIRNIVLREYEYAVNNLIVHISKRDMDISVMFPIVNGQQLAAIRNDEQKYIYFSKKLIHWYIVNNQLESARSELEEWGKLLPDDREIKDLDKLYQSKLIAEC